MSKKFDELKLKIKNMDKSGVKLLIADIKKAREDGEIDEQEKKELMASAKSAFGDLNLGSFFKKEK